MPELRIVVCVKVVPKPEEVRVDPQSPARPPQRPLRNQSTGHERPGDGSRPERPYGGTINLLSMGPPSFEPTLRVGLAMGCDHIYLLSDRAFAGADTLATTYTLAQAIHKLGGADLVFCGEESSDGATGQVP